MRHCTSNINEGLKTVKAFSFALFLLLGIVFLSSPATAQCDETVFVDACAANLGEEYSYLRTFESEEIEESTDYPYTGAFLFRKGVNYVFTSCGVSEKEERIVVNLYNRTRKKVASTYNKESGKHYEKMIFKCNATGIFFVQTLTALDEKSCGITMLGFSAQ